MSACKVCRCVPCKHGLGCPPLPLKNKQSRGPLPALCPHGTDLTGPPWHSDHPEWGVCNVCYRTHPPSAEALRAAAIDVALLRALASTLEALGEPLAATPGFDGHAVRDRLVLLVDGWCT